jgi:predicted nucleic acid-binding protein
MVVDASVLVSGFLLHDVHYDASRRWLSRHVAGGGLVLAPTLIFAELAGAVARRSGSPRLGRRAVEAIQRLPTLRLIMLDEPLSRTAANLAARLRLRGSDAVYVATAALLRVPLLTWDAEQRERAARIVDVISPG